MAWYRSLFDDVYGSPIGAKILVAIETTARAGHLQDAFLCYLTVRKLERVAMRSNIDSELTEAIDNVLKVTETIGFPLSAEDLKRLKKIFERNGFSGWSV